MPTGLYISVPFCRSKCSYCNFSSGVFSRELMSRYVQRVCDDICRAVDTATKFGAEFDRRVDSVYLGGGTPTMLAPDQLKQLFVCIRGQFEVLEKAETTIECAPATLTRKLVDAMVGSGVNRVSLGVQSFVDAEAAAVGRLHTRDAAVGDIALLRAAGIENLSVDLIAGLPHQNAQSWEFSVAETIDAGVRHASVYMLEVDEESRLGRELIAGGTRYHAHFAPDQGLVADYYLAACERLQSAGLAQYEISNFAQPGFESCHNRKYWTRQPYFGFGLDAHSMLEAASDPYLLLPALEGRAKGTPGGAPCAVVAANIEAVRFAMPDTLDAYLAGEVPAVFHVSRIDAIEETFFLGLRLNQGVDLRQVARRFGEQAIDELMPVIRELEREGLAELEGRFLRLTNRGRLLSNEVFQRFLVPHAGS